VKRQKKELEVGKKQFLTGEQITELRQVAKSKKSSNVETRRAQAILIVSSDNFDEIILKALTGFGRQYASRLRSKYLATGIAGILEKKRKPRALLTKNELKEVGEILDTKSPKDYEINADFWTTSILAELVNKRYNVVYKSKTSYCLIFKNSGFSFHKPEKRYHERNQAAIDKWRAEVLPEIQGYLVDPQRAVLAEDEMIATSQTTTQKVWLPRGKSSHVEASNKRDKKCIYGFLNLQTGREHAFKTDYTNSQTTCTLLKELMILYPDKLITIIWDNAPWHRSKMVRDFLVENPNRFHLIAFTPYAPEENPQEHVWKSGRAAVTHNKYIGKIDVIVDELVGYLNATNFDYKL